MSVSTFAELSLDVRLEKALVKAGYEYPMPIQAHGLPIILSQSLDILVHAKTGSGKTLLYIIPILVECLKCVSINDQVEKLNKRSIVGIIVLPTKDLARQVADLFSSLMRYCPEEIRMVNLCSDTSELFMKSVLSSSPSILITTPSLLYKFINNKSIKLADTLKYFIVDEADFILGIGYESDLNNIIKNLTPSCKRILLSATLNDDIDILKKKLLSKPAVITLQDSSDLDDPSTDSTISHFYSQLVSNEDKYILLLALLKLKLLTGKILVFTNSVVAAYKACVLNGELPLASRFNIIEEANRGKFDCVIAVDQIDLNFNKSKKGQKNKDGEFGISRGIDFKGLSIVINFDLPDTIKSYCHRAGRTGRNKERGTILSFFTESENNIFSNIFSFIESQQSQMKPFVFDMNQIEGIRYRAVDVLNGITPNRINEAKLKDLKNHILISEKLKNHFETNPLDLKALRQDQDLKSKKNKSHLKHLPDYLLAHPSAPSVKHIYLPKLDETFKETLPKSLPSNSSLQVTKKRTSVNQFKQRNKRRSRDPLNKIK